MSDPNVCVDVFDYRRKWDDLTSKMYTLVLCCQIGILIYEAHFLEPMTRGPDLTRQIGTVKTWISVTQLFGPTRLMICTWAFGLRFRVKLLSISN